MQGNNDKHNNHDSSNEMKIFLEKIKTQLEKQTKRETKPNFPEEEKIVFKGTNFKYEIEQLINQNIL